MNDIEAQKRATLAGLAAAFFCTVFWLGGGMALLAFQGGVA
jgi:hypothetical protein